MCYSQARAREMQLFCVNNLVMTHFSCLINIVYSFLLLFPKTTYF